MDPIARFLVPIQVEDEMRSSYLDYSMSVIVGRALPDARDGLKPVHRRILYAMLREGLVAGRRYSKCAGVVGEVLKKYHPHGDMAVYDSLGRRAQPWNMRYLLVDGQGNFGSVDGDNAAAYRYTECRMTRLAEDLLADQWVQPLFGDDIGLAMKAVFQVVLESDEVEKRAAFFQGNQKVDIAGFTVRATGN